MQKLEIYLKKLLLKQVQNLPEKTANEATYLMMRITQKNFKNFRQYHKKRQLY
jgi:hypothetical protein